MAVELKSLASSGLADWLHDEVPRGDLSFEKVSNVFLPDDSKYQESMIMIAAPFVLALLLTILQRLVRCCCKCCCSNNRLSKSFKEAKPHPTRWVVLFLFVALAVFGGVAYGYFANEQVRDGIEAITDAVRDMDQLIKDNIATADEVSVTLGNIDTDAQSLKATINGASSADSSDAEQTLDTVSSEVRSAKVSLEDGTSSADDVTLDDTVDLLETVEHNRWLAQLAFLALLLLPYIFALDGIGCKSRAMLAAVPTVTLIVTLLGWLVVAAETPLVVALGDLCVDPTGYLTERAPGVGDNSETTDYIRFFTICEGVPNPLGSEIDSAQDAINTSQVELTTLWSEIETLRPHISPGNYSLIVNDYYELSNSTDTLANQVDHIEQVVFTCNGVHNIYVDAMNAVCGDTLTGLAKLDGVQAGLCFLSWIAIASASTLYAYHKNGDLKNAARSSRRLDFLVSGNGNGDPGQDQEYMYPDDNPDAGGRRGKKKKNAPAVQPL